MAGNIPLPGGERERAAELLGGVHYPLVKLILGGYGVNLGPVSAANPLPVSLIGGEGGGLTDAQLRASPVAVSGTFWQATQPVSGTVGISGTVPVSGTFWQATQPVSGTFWQATQPVSIAASVAVTGTFWQATQPVSGPLTNAELRASPVSVSIGASQAFTFVSTNNAAPAANAVQADTGQLAAGDYELIVNLMVSDTVAVGKGLIIEHRNAANNANINILGGASPNGNIHLQIAKLTLAANERIRVIAGTAAGAVSSRYVSAIGRRAA